MCVSAGSAGGIERPSLRDEQRRANRPAEIAEGGEGDVGRVVADEQVLAHLILDPLEVWLAKAQAEAAAEDHGLRVEEVDRRRDSRAERADCAVDELDRESARSARE